MTEETQAMAADLIAFQKEVPEIKFNAAVSYGATKFKYADLAQLLNILRPLLNKHNFALSQSVNTGVMADGQPYGIVETQLVHKSGAGISSKTFYNITGKPQDQGSGITYARRYALAAICGICAEDDDDAQKAAGSKEVQSKQSAINEEYRKRLKSQKGENN